jgi:hypothetical protein
MNSITLHTKDRIKGNASIKLLILTILIFTLVVLLLPSGDDKIRARVERGLDQVGQAKNALVAACRAGDRKTVARNTDAGFYFIESVYIAEIRLQADCASGEMGIRVRTQNTGAEMDPEILLISNTSDAAADTNQPEWRCGIARGEISHVPDSCRTVLSMG